MSLQNGGLTTKIMYLCLIVVASLRWVRHRICPDTKVDPERNGVNTLMTSCAGLAPCVLTRSSNTFWKSSGRKLGLSVGSVTRGIKGERKWQRKKDAAENFISVGYKEGGVDNVKRDLAEFERRPNQKWLIFRWHSVLAPTSQHDSQHLQQQLLNAALLAATLTFSLVLLQSYLRFAVVNATCSDPEVRKEHFPLSAKVEAPPSCQHLHQYL
jgi:hypothetical protein